MTSILIKNNIMMTMLMSSMKTTWFPMIAFLMMIGNMLVLFMYKKNYMKWKVYNKF